MNPDRQERLLNASRLRQMDLAVVLENVHDTHNIGAVLRTCDSVGIQSVYVVYTDPTLSPNKFKLGKRTSGGARKWVDVFVYRDMHECIKVVREKYGRILALTMTPPTDALHDVDFSGPTALVFGNEHQGISKELLKLCNGNVHIPQMGMVKSLNISVACAVTLYEVFRQRRAKKMYIQNTTASESEFDRLYEDFIARHESGYVGRRPK